MKIWATILSIIFLIFVVAMLWLYWFTGFRDISLTSKSDNSNFSLENKVSTASDLKESNFSLSGSSNMQFYNNMRYSNFKISYRISDACTLQKKADAEGAFEILENKTILDFYPVQNNEEILISCEDKQRIKEDFFIAGEGGPVNITQAGEFNVILYGEVSLIRQSECQNPNVALHEILHALGFDHSGNPNNIMYNISKCSQTLGDDIPMLIDELYSIPSYADLVLEDIVPVIHGKYLDVNLTVKNNGFKDAPASVIKIYMDDVFVDEMNLEALEIGFGMKIMLQNVYTKKSNFDALKFVVETNFEELDKKNNEAIFEAQSN